MLNALQDYGHIEIDQCLVDAVPVFDKGWPWSQQKVTQPIRNLGLTAPMQHSDQTLVTGFILAVGDEEIHVPTRREKQGKVSTYVIDLANARYIERDNETLFEDEFRFLPKVIPGATKDRLRDELGRANHSTTQKPVLILG